MGWGISPKASKKEKIKVDLSDTLKGLNSTAELSYEGYDILWDKSMKLLDDMYELGKEEGKKEVE